MTRSASAAVTPSLRCCCLSRCMTNAAGAAHAGGGGARKKELERVGRQRVSEWTGTKMRHTDGVRAACCCSHRQAAQAPWQRSRMPLFRKSFDAPAGKYAAAAAAGRHAPPRSRSSSRRIMPASTSSRSWAKHTRGTLSPPWSIFFVALITSATVTILPKARVSLSAPPTRSLTLSRGRGRGGQL